MDRTKLAQILGVTSHKVTLKKAASHPSGQLTPRQVVRLAAAISDDNMVAIAEGYFVIPSRMIQNIKVENKDDVKAFNRELIRQWMNENPEDQQQVLTNYILEF